MTRACETCEWSRQQQCREGPVPIAVDRDHWCGRWRLAEHLAAGTAEALSQLDWINTRRAERMAGHDARLTNTERGGA